MLKAKPKQEAVPVSKQTVEPAKVDEPKAAPIDVGALRRFQDLMTPIMSAIPSLFDLEAQQRDADRALQAKKAEAAEIERQAQQKQALADSQLASAQQSAISAKAETNRQIDALKQADAAFAESQKVAVKHRDDALAALDKKIADRQAELAGLDAELLSGREDILKSHQALSDSLKQETEALEASRANARGALDALRTQLGV